MLSKKALRLLKEVTDLKKNRLKLFASLVKDVAEMSADHLVQLLQNGFRVTLGATASLVEVLQDSEKRHENLAKLRQEWSVLSSEWAQKGEVTEQEARNFVDTLLAQRAHQQTATSGTASTTTAPSASPDIQLELQELTAQIIAMRAELETLRNQNTPS